eukprot:TRINITY_DN13008_c0_g1_i1.p1 TRINITY_DN13008_c0_g1~~TRINITY_DN13008_c0_g1_i1.p1  ORF type:complete len:157 (-),score=22.86 TRINITY_DN13008_c0_g1_i1:210-680(-)
MYFSEDVPTGINGWVIHTADGTQQWYYRGGFIEDSAERADLIGTGWRMWDKFGFRHGDYHPEGVDIQCVTPRTPPPAACDIHLTGTSGIPDIAQIDGYYAISEGPDENGRFIYENQSNKKHSVLEKYRDGYRGWIVSSNEDGNIQTVPHPYDALIS